MTPLTTDHWVFICRHSGDWTVKTGGQSSHHSEYFADEDVSRRNYNQRNLQQRGRNNFSLSLENLNSNEPDRLKCDKIFSSKQRSQLSSNNGAQLRWVIKCPLFSSKELFITSCSRQRRQFYQGDMKKSPSTPNLNWRYAMTEDTAPVQEQEQVVRRRQRKVVRPRPRSELIRDRGGEETWVDGLRWDQKRVLGACDDCFDYRERRPASYVDTGTREKDYYIQTCKKTV